jgi:cellulose synthase/poly-beta-1,6-N-acetylglucosamine synthase-like glycosyltransferase
MMKWVFWVSVAMVVYTYVGYPVCLYLRTRWRPRPVQKAPITPFVSIIVAVHNEAHTLARKLQNLFELDYPANCYEVVVVSDGSTDGTNEMLASCSDPRLRLKLAAQREGKAAALNRGVELAQGEIIVFTDARQLLERDAVRKITSSFADPAVGCVSGELLLGQPGAAADLSGEKLKWGIENKIRLWEGMSGSVIGALGAFYAARRALCVEIPKGTLLDDCYIPLNVVRKGARVVFEAEARAWDDIAPDPRAEFRRKVRTLAGNYQLIQMAPWLINPANPVFFEFVSHKLLRLLVPFALIAILISSILLDGAIYTSALVLQVAFYGVAVLAAFQRKWGRVGRFADVALTVVLLNAAAIMALMRFVTGRKDAWAGTVGS